MRQGRLVATGAMLAFCLFALWQSLLLSLTDRLGPGPGFFPFWLALIGALLAIALLISTVREPAGPSIGDAERILPYGPGGRRWACSVLRTTPSTPPGARTPAWCAALAVSNRFACRMRTSTRASVT